MGELPHHVQEAVSARWNAGVFTVSCLTSCVSVTCRAGGSQLGMCGFPLQGRRGPPTWPHGDTPSLGLLSTAHLGSSLHVLSVSCACLLLSRFLVAGDPWGMVCPSHLCENPAQGRFLGALWGLPPPPLGLQVWWQVCASASRSRGCLVSPLSSPGGQKRCDCSRVGCLGTVTQRTPAGRPETSLEGPRGRLAEEVGKQQRGDPRGQLVGSRLRSTLWRVLGTSAPRPAHAR